MRLDYFYNTEGENFRFYQIPALLLEEEEYRGISDTAKILYGVFVCCCEVVVAPLIRKGMDMAIAMTTTVVSIL